MDGRYAVIVVVERTEKGKSVSRRDGLLGKSRELVRRPAAWLN